MIGHLKRQVNQKWFNISCSRASVLFYNLTMHQPEPTITGSTTLGSVWLALIVWY